MARTLTDLSLPLADIDNEGSRRNFLTRATGVTPDLVDGWLDGERRRFYFWHGTELGSIVLYHAPAPVLRQADDLREVGPTVYTLAPLPPPPRGPLDFADYTLPHRALTPSASRKAVALINALPQEQLEVRSYNFARLPVATRYDLIDRIGRVLPAGV